MNEMKFLVRFYVENRAYMSLSRIVTSDGGSACVGIDERSYSYVGPGYHHHHNHHHMVFLTWPKQQRHHEDHYSQSKYEQYQSVL